LEIFFIVIFSDLCGLGVFARDIPSFGCGLPRQVLRGENLFTVNPEEPYNQTAKNSNRIILH
jgi:hypothetical protein